MLKPSFAAVLALFLTTVPVLAQTQCMPIEVFNSMVMKMHGESPLATGRTEGQVNGQPVKYTMRLYVDMDDLSFTVVMIPDLDKTKVCMIAAGDRFRPMVPEDLEGEPPILPGKDKLNMTVIPKRPVVPSDSF